MPSIPTPETDPAKPPASGIRLWAAPGWPLALLSCAAAALAALFGFGLAVSVQQALGASAGLLGAVVGAVVAAVAVPLAWRGRLPGRPVQTPRAAAAPLAVVKPVGSAASVAGLSAAVGPAGQAGAGAKVVSLHALPGMGRRPGEALPGMPPAAATTAAPFTVPFTAPLAVPVTGPITNPDTTLPARDALTGAYTQAHFVAAADREWSRIRRHGGDAAMLMVDVDHFKSLNQQFGQAAGDALLVELTRQVSATLRQYDLLARFGGGVLVVYLPHTDPIGALDVAERIRERVMAVRLNWQDMGVKASVSVGVTGIGVAHGRLEDVIADAGAALREAKAAGRNCVRAAPIAPRHHAADGHDPGSRRPAGPV